MSTSNERPRVELRSILFICIIGGALGLGVILFIFMLTGRFTVNNDSRFAEFHVCRDGTHYEPIQTIPMGTKEFYVCGTVKGHGLRVAAFDLYLANHLLDSDSYFEHYPGIFFERFSLDQELQVGQYRIEAVSAKSVIAKTEFSVVKK